MRIVTFSKSLWKRWFSRPEPEPTPSYQWETKTYAEILAEIREERRRRPRIEIGASWKERGKIFQGRKTMDYSKFIHIHPGPSIPAENGLYQI